MVIHHPNYLNLRLSLIINQLPTETYNCFILKWNVKRSKQQRFIKKDSNMKIKKTECTKNNMK